MGIEIHDSWLEDDDHEGVWSRHLPALNAFLAVSDQWSVVGMMNGIHYLGLDNSRVRDTLEMLGIKLTPGEFADLQDIAEGACKALNEARP